MNRAVNICVDAGTHRNDVLSENIVGLVPVTKRPMEMWEDE